MFRRDVLLGQSSLKVSHFSSIQNTDKCLLLTPKPRDVGGACMQSSRGNSLGNPTPKVDVSIFEGQNL